MTERDLHFSARRIVLALQPGCGNLNALETAAELADRIKAELHGVFFEDEQLLNLAALPFARQVSLHTTTSRPLDMADIETELRAAAERWRRHMADISSRLKVAWSFEIVRGDRSSVLSATRKSDLLVVETMTRPFAPHMWLPTEWSNVVATCERTCLLLGLTSAKWTGVCVVHDGTANADRALAAAVIVGDSPNARLTVITAEAVLRRAGLRQRLEGLAASADLHILSRMDAADVLRSVRSSHCALAIAPASHVATHRAEWQDFLAAPPCDVLLMT